MEVNWIVMLNEFVEAFVHGVGFCSGAMLILLCFNLYAKTEKQ